MATQIIRKEFDIPDTKEYHEIQRLSYENDCRIANIRRLISSSEFNINNGEILDRLVKEYVDLAVKRDMMYYDKVRTMVPKDCLNVVHWEFTGFDKLVICGEYEVND